MESCLGLRSWHHVGDEDDYVLKNKSASETSKSTTWKRTVHHYWEKKCDEIPYVATGVAESLIRRLLQKAIGCLLNLIVCRWRM